MTTPNSTVSDERLAVIADSDVTHLGEAQRMARELQRLRSLSTGTDARVRVKPLEWQPESGMGYHRAQSPCGEYAITEDLNHRGTWVWWKGDRASGEFREPSLSEAKAAADADHKSRILSDLEQHPAPSTDAGVRVKELQWDGNIGHGAGFKYIIAEPSRTPGWRVWVNLTDLGPNGMATSIGGHIVTMKAENRNDATATAQADFEQRVLSALEQQPAASQEGEWKPDRRSFDAGWEEGKRFGMSRPNPTSKGKVSEEMVSVPKSAVDWLMGSGPDPDGHWFGDAPDDAPAARAFWWRTKFSRLAALTGKGA